MLQPEIDEWVTRRVSQTLRVILREKDRAVDPHVPASVAARFRRVVMDEVNAFADDVRAVLDRAQPDNVLVNGYALDRIDERRQALDEDT